MVAQSESVIEKMIETEMIAMLGNEGKGRFIKITGSELD